MHFRRSSPGREAEIEHRAAEWLARRDRGMSAAEQDEFFHWLAADPRHGEWFARHQQTVKGLKILVQWRPEHGAQPNPDLLAEPRPRSGLSWRGLGWVASGLAAAAGLMVAWTLWRNSDLPSTARPTETVAVRIDPAPVLRRLLEDGSTIDLNHGAEVEVSFSADERRVRLVRGEAHFTVAKNPRRPFIVQADRVAVRAVGTAFDVRLADESVEVLVTEGRVRVDPAANVAAVGPFGGSDVAASPTIQSGPEHAFVTAGERALVSLTSVDLPPAITAVPVAEMERLLAWQPRQLEFTDAPLAQVVAEFNRDNRVKLVVADPILAALPIGATLRSDNVEGFVRLLETSFHVAVERRPDGVVVLRRAP